MGMDVSVLGESVVLESADGSCARERHRVCEKKAGRRNPPGFFHDGLWM